MNKRSLILPILALALVCSAQAEPVKDHLPASEKSGDTYHRPVCPKTSGAQVMRCHSLVVTDSKGNPIENAAPPHRQLPNGKQQSH